MEPQGTPSSAGTAAPTKVSRPWLPAIFPRERLFARLDALADRPGTWIGAPGGYGKTTLAASYVEARGIPCLWYQIDEDDADPATFFYYLGIAADVHGTGPPLPLLTPDYQGDLSAFARRYFRDLFQRLAPPCALLLDNYHRLPARALLHALLAETLDLLPAGARCLVASRGEPPPELARARLHGQLAIIEAEALRLTLPEAEGIAELQSERRPTASEVRPLNERVQGWAAGLILLLRHVRPDWTLLPEATAEQVFDYFAAEVWSQTDPALQTFLLKTALLPTMTAAMARHLTGDDQADARLSALARRHSFTFRRESVAADGATWTTTYQYHDLLRAFLLSRGREAFGATEREQDQCRAAALLEAAGELGAAAELWQAAGDWAALGRLIIRHAPPLLQQGRGQLLESWLAGFPPAIRNQSPWLLFWLGQCQLPRDPVTARTTLARAYRHFKRTGDVTGLWLSWSSITDTYQLAWDNFRAAGGWLVEFERLRVRYPRFPSVALETRVTCGVFNIMVYARPEHPEFADWERRIAQLLQTDCPPDLYLVSLNTLLFHYIWNVGQRARAAWALDLLRAAHANTTPIEPVLHCASQCWEFCYQYYFEGDLDRCLILANAAWATVVEHGISLFNSHALSNFVCIHLCTGQLEAARAALAQHKPVLKSFRPLERAYYIRLQGWEAWLSGRLLEAVEKLEQSLRISRRCFYQSAGFSQLALAQVQASLGHRAEALRYLAGMRSWIRATDSQLGAFVRTLAVAQFALAWGRLARCLRLLRRALALARVQGYIFFSFFKPDDVARLCAVALEAGIEVEYVQNLIRKRGLLPDPSAAISERWPWPVKVYTLGRFALVVDDQPVNFGRKAQRKPLELLKILIAWGGRDVSQARIADALWPDADGDAGQQALTTTLHRLRRLLDRDQALCLRDGRLSLDPRYCWVDAWCLERRINQILSQVRESDGRTEPTDLATATHALLRAYRGQFLGQDPEPWAIRTRDRLRDRYLKGLEEIGDYWERRGNRVTAHACYEQGLEAAPASERCSRGLMRCHDQME